MDLTRVGADQTRVPLSKGGGFKLEQNNTRRVEFAFATDGDARVRYDVKSAGRVAVSMKHE